MRIGRQAAKIYITDEVLLEMSHKVARAMAAEKGYTPLRLVRNED